MKKLSEERDFGSISCQKILTGHKDGATTVIQLKDGRIASSSYDGTIKIWSIQSGECELTLSGHTGSVWGPIECTNGTIATAGSSDFTIKIWDIHSVACVLTLDNEYGAFFYSRAEG